MLKLQPNIPVKETYNYLAKFPRFSMIQKISPNFYPTSSQASIAVANVIKDEIIRKNNLGEKCVLGLATGSTPIGVYKQLIKMHKNGELSFKNVVTFNLDEYYPIEKTNPQSYNYYMNYHLFNHIDIPKQNINIPNGQIQKSQIIKFCAQYQKKIKSQGGIDLQILGIGRSGHIGFNQPPSPVNSITRLVYLNKITRKDAANSFGGFQKVPKSAITMGINTINKAKKIIIMAWSQNKAPIVKKTIQGNFDQQIPATFLHQHQDATFYLDKAAGDQLTRFNIPWIIKGDIEDPIVPKTSYWIIKCVTWLSQKVGKPLLRLTYDDYQDNHLSQFVMQCANGSVQDLNLYVYKKIMSRITGWPLGSKPQQLKNQQSLSISRKAIRMQKVLIFSPHPDDDIISMGGTLKKLHDQGHNVTVAYMTSGANGVGDLQAKKYMYFLKDFCYNFLQQSSKQLNEKDLFLKNFNKMFQSIDQNSKGDENVKLKNILNVKKFIRSSQAKVCLNSINLKQNQVYNLDLPFYGTSHKKRGKPTQEDAQIIRSLLRAVQPTVIFAAGDLTDPHGTHRKCLDIILNVYDEQMSRSRKQINYKCIVPLPQKFYLYRGAWQEWDIAMARLIIPMSPKDVEDKMNAIWKHQSQKDGALYLGEDKRQFWVRAKQRNRNTAELLNKLGCPDYEACQCFVNLNDLKNYDQL